MKWRELLENSNTSVSLINQLMLIDPEFPIEFATATLVSEVDSLIHQSFFHSGLTVDELAEKLKTSADRVQQILDAEGNVKTTTLARWLKACGFSIKLQIYSESVDKQGNVTQTPQFFNRHRS